ncbi:hypothetical protein HAX54_030249 [Datura stramonium]|uniref:Uncharacterized protein n=1 Tax=Datura stramonium TaxID=4076 RepID=A0ABS8Y8K3_DATST|nr:hypothetical protein [Datura stramonium]
MSMGVQIIESSNVTSILIEEEMFMNWMDIKNLLESNWSPDIQISVDVLLESFKDPEEVHVTDGAKSRKRRNLEDEISDEDTNKCKK